MRYVRNSDRLINGAKGVSGGDNPDKATKKYTWMGVFASPCVLEIPIIKFV